MQRYPPRQSSVLVQAIVQRPGKPKRAPTHALWPGGGAWRPERERERDHSVGRHSPSQATAMTKVPGHMLADASTAQPVSEQMPQPLGVPP